MPRLRNIPENVLETEMLIYTGKQDIKIWTEQVRIKHT